MNSEQETEGRPAEDAAFGGDFRLFVQKLGYQALISLGVIENPLTQTAEAKPDLARAVIDDLRMLRDKTRGNLDEDEEGHITGVIQNLELHAAKLAGTKLPETRG